MKLASVWARVLAGAAVAAAAADLYESDPNHVRAASVYVQPVVAVEPSSPPPPPPALLAEIRYDVLDPAATAQVVAYEPPGEDEDEGENEGEGKEEKLYRVGLYDSRAKQWLGGTSVAAASNFAKGFRPHFVLTVAPTGGSGSGSGSAGQTTTYLGVSVRGFAIDAGATRDFGPQATVVVAGRGATPVLNRPVVLSPEGRKPAPEEEKTFFQRYWWAIALALVMVLTTGGGDDK